MVMVWLEGRQGEVSRPFAPPPPITTSPNRPTWTPRSTDPPRAPPPLPLLDPPPHSPLLEPPLQSPPPANNYLGG